jgi:hypothetical protein
MKTKFWTGIVLVICFGCGPEIFYETNTSKDFNKFKRTYAFLPRVDSSKNNLFENDIMDENIQRLITENLSQRNYQIDIGKPELLVRFHLMVENKEDIINTPVYNYPYMPYGFYRFPFFYYPGPIYLGSNNQRIAYKEGTLVIDLIERSSGQLVWRAWSVERLTDPVKYTKQLPEMISRMFIHYPIKK